MKIVTMRITNFQKHLLQFEGEVMTSIDELKHEFINDDWEDEFDDIDEAYEEQGRGQAESQAVQELIKREYPDMKDDALVKMMDFLADFWFLSYN